MMSPRIMIHHSCCGEAGAESDPSHPGIRYLIHPDGTISGPPPAAAGPAGHPDHLVEIILVGYFNSNNRIGTVDSRQLCSMTELIGRLLYSGDEIFRYLLCHNRYCPGFKFPWEELEWRLWNKLS